MIVELYRTLTKRSVMRIVMVGSPGGNEGFAVEKSDDGTKWMFHIKADSVQQALSAIESEDEFEREEEGEA